VQQSDGVRDPSVETSLPPPGRDAVPRSPEELSAEWLTACLRHAGALSGGRVVAFEQQRVGRGKGFAGHLARLELVYEDPLPESPKRLVAKFASEHDDMRELMDAMGGYRREVRFYRELARDVGVPTPRCFLAHYDQAGGRFLLLLEDMAPAASPGVERGLSLEQARTVMEQLAHLHARWWNREAELPWLQLDDEIIKLVRDQYLKALPTFLEQWSARYPTLSRVARGIAHMFEGDEWVAQVRARPRTLVHNDMHVENIFLPTEAGGRFAFIDWQGVSFGRHGVGDVTRILCMGMSTELRRAHTAELLRHYHTKLIELGVEGYDYRALKRRYREEVVSMVIVGVMAFDTIDFEGEGSAQTATILGDRIEAAVIETRMVRALTIYVALKRAQRFAGRLLGGT